MSKRAFISHTSLIADFPTKKDSFVKAAIDGVKDAGWTYEEMQQFPSSPNSPLADSLLKVRGCDAYIGILGWDWGSEPPERPGVSYTRCEFMAAKDTMPTLFFITSEKTHAFPADSMIGISENDKTKQRLFRSEAQRLHAKFFSQPHELRRQVADALRSLDPTQAPCIAARPDLKPYLNWVIDQCQWVDFSLVEPNSQFSPEHWRMEERYVKLQAEVRQGYVSYGRQEVTDVLRTNPLVALLGEPGEGKTTALRYVAVNYAKAALNDEEPVPIFLQARTLAQHLDQKLKSDPAVGDFCDVWNSEVVRHRWGIPTTWLELMLEKGVFVMIDELDAIPEESSQRVLMLIRDCTARYPNSRWCVVSRSFAWQHSLLPAFRIATMCDLADNTIQHYIRSWGINSSSMLPAGSNPSAFTEGLWQEIQKNPALHDLARRPLFLMAICVIYCRKLLLPSDRAELLKMITEWLIESRDPHSGRFTQEVRLHVYDWTAFAMCELPVSSRGDIGELSRRLYECGLEKEGVNRQMISRFLENESKATGLLRCESGVWRPLHRTFQDFFAARHLISMATWDDNWARVVKGRIHDAEWGDVFALFAAILVSEGRQSLVARLVRLLLEDADCATLREKATAVGLVLHVFRYVRPENYSLDSVEEYRKMAAELVAIFDPTEAAKIPIEERYDVAVALGVRGDLRLRRVTPTMVRIEPGAVWVGAQARDTFAPNYDNRASELEGPVAIVFSGAFDIGCYPVTVHEYERLVDDGGYDAKRGREYWSKEGWAHKERENRICPANWSEQRRKPNCPVTGINVFEAEAYCRWLTKQAHDETCYRLPSEDEWEFAVRRKDKEYRAYSWGNEPKNLSNIFGFNQVVPVGLFVEDRSLSGLCDLSCNVSEWTLDPAGRFRQPGPRVARHHVSDEGETLTRIIRGGNYRNNERSNRSAVRSGKQSHVGYAYVGFRVVRYQKAVKIKDERPMHEFPHSLADYFQYYAHVYRDETSSRRGLLNAISEGLGDEMEARLAELFPANFRQRRLLPCRLGDHPSKFEFNLLYQDSRIKVACEKQRGTNSAKAGLIREVELRQHAIACILAFPQEGIFPLWQDINDNDLDAIVFAVLIHFDPEREATLQRQGLADNEMAMAALPSRAELELWELEKVIKYQVFAGVRLLNNMECELARQFDRLGEFRAFMLNEFRDQLSRSKRLLFLFDDNGELVWDLALIELLLDKYPKLTIIGLVSTEAVGNNATAETLDSCLSRPRFASLKHHERFNVHKEKNSRSCIDPVCASPEFQRLWNGEGCIYLKGVAAFETLQLLPNAGFYAFVVYSNDSVRCTAYERDTGILLAVPRNFECFRYGDDPAWTLKARCAHLPSSQSPDASREM
ncbi:MAG: SUMF1/EgtB/PvdO family nonheme iron enzyme [Verrucomicrobia bacterium]|nr:SUMF1/EgtB/PvdO family nonheme iron enzyme [Verrucomicrobiota bacterium]